MPDSQGHRGLPNTDREGNPMYNVGLTDEMMTGIIDFFDDKEVDEALCVEIVKRITMKRKQLRDKVNAGNHHDNRTSFVPPEEVKSEPPVRRQRPRLAFDAD